VTMYSEFTTKENNEIHKNNIVNCFDTHYKENVSNITLDT